jgi:hypothetical protein
MLGTAAAFAAIEIGGAPIRVENAMRLTCVGEDAQIQRQGKKKTSPFKVYIPAELTKQDGLTEDPQPIEFPIRHNKHGCHDTLVWYMEKIRPLPARGVESLPVPGRRYAGASERQVLFRSVRQHECAKSSICQ